MKLKILYLLQKFHPFAMAFSFYLILAAVYYPGFVDPDNFFQFEQASKWRIYHDLQSPFYVFIWMIFGNITGDQSLIFLMHLAMFVVGALLVLKSIFKKTYVYLPLFVVVSAFPVTFSWLGSLTKDTSIFCLLWLFFGIQLYSRNKINTKKYQILLLVIVVFIGLMRANAHLLAIPLVLLLANNGIKKQNLSRSVKRTLLYLVLYFSVVVSINGSLKIIFNYKNSHAEQQIYIQDLAGLSVELNKMLIPFPKKQKKYNNSDFKFLTIEELKEIYDPVNIVPVMWGEKNSLRYRFKKIFINRIKTSWIYHVRRNFSTYLKIRWNMFSNLIGISKNKFITIDGTKNWKSTQLKSKKFKGKMKTYKKDIFQFGLENGLFRGYYYIIICLSSMVISLISILAFKKTCYTFFWVSFAGTVYSLAYFFIAPVNFFRLLLPTVACAQFLILCLIKDFLNMIKLNYSKKT